MANENLRYYASFKSCEGDYIDFTTDAGGRFRLQTESTQGGVGVVTQEIAICFEQVGKWYPLWSTVTGGGAPKIVLACAPPQDPDTELCELTIPGASDA